MRPDGVVFLQPVLNHTTCLSDRVKRPTVQTTVTKHTIEAFVIGTITEIIEPAAQGGVYVEGLVGTPVRLVIRSATALRRAVVPGTIA